MTAFGLLQVRREIQGRQCAFFGLGHGGGHEALLALLLFHFRDALGFFQKKLFGFTIGTGFGDELDPLHLFGQTGCGKAQ